MIFLLISFAQTGGTPLIVATAKGDEKVVNLLLAANANVNATDNVRYESTYYAPKPSIKTPFYFLPFIYLFILI